MYIQINLGKCPINYNVYSTISPYLSLARIKFSRSI
jgi:hypothetical protein